LDQQTAPKVFISYSHDSPTHKADVLALANRLRNDGIDCRIDRYVNGAPKERWIRWMKRQIEWADFVLVVCTKIYLERFDGDDRLGGRGVNFEGLLISQTLYDQFLENTKFLPLIPENGSIDYVPWILKGGTTYKIHSDYETLCRVLTNQPEVEMPPLGQRVILSPIKQQALNNQMPSAETQARETEQAINDGSPQSRRKLINLLAKELNRKDFQALVTDYIERINDDFNTSFPCSPTSDNTFASYLVNQADDERRRLQVLHFLDAFKANDGVKNVEDLLGYLLHILIRNDQIDCYRINHMPFEHPATLDLLTARRNQQALIPDYTETEFTNGLKKHGVFHSDYQPQIGVWEKDRVCREIAKQLLASINELRADSKDPLKELSDLLGAYDTDRRNQPIKGIRIHQSALNKHPLSDNDIAEYFLQKIGPALPVYVYGAEIPGNASDYLHIDENKIGAIVGRYRRESGSKSIPTPPQER
jgi:hypothetical protein